ncbi:DUF4261 domain-containing protein [Hahella aquimaris]|uniref:DUF4261 domain-containing protein n=1 Tax=Hahella sp. HNIBRBA332 TaxID=3015983 RepID=UPI00273C6AF9|nr:DUF4261 domain-containing protein [Hahella sp. HNIBRBA332]WLQ15871.1 DUF4261 domain-containing protein [Hahella sp. HNIBRBA332]
MSNQVLNTIATFPSIMQIILLERPIDLPITELEKLLRDKIGNPNITVHGTENASDGLIIMWNERPYTVLSIDQPVPSSTFNTALQTSYNLVNGEQLVSNHKAHLIISPGLSTDDQLQAIFSALCVMTITDLLAQCATPLAFYWPCSDMLEDREQYAMTISSADKAMADFNDHGPIALYGLPIPYLTGIRFFSLEEKNKVGAVTQGLEALSGFEIQIDPFECKPSEVAKHLYCMVGYVLANGPIFVEGNTIGIEGSKPFSMRRIPANDSQPDVWAMKMETMN